MKKTLQLSNWFFMVFSMLMFFCNMPSDPFKKPSNSKARLFLKENEQTIDFGSEVKIGVSIFLAEHIEALHIKTRNNGLDSIHPYSSNAVDDTLYFCHKFNVEGKDTIFVTGILKDKNYMNKTDTLPVFILPAPDSIRFDSIPQSLFTVTENHDTLQFIASLRSEKPLSFSVKSQPALDTNQLKIAQFKDTVRVVLTTDSTGEYAVTLYAQRDTLIDSAVVNVTAYEPLVFESAVLSDIIPFGKNDTLVFTVPTEREDTLTCKLLNKDNFAENELSVIKENSDSLVIVFTPDSGGEHEFLLLLDNGKIKDTLKYTVTVDDNPSVGVFIENHKDTVPFGDPVNMGVSVFLPQLIEELHISTNDNSLDSTLELSATDDTVYVSHEFCTEGEVKIYVTAKPVNSNYEEKIDSLTINVLPAPEKISFNSIPGKLHTVTGLTDTLLFLAKSSKGNSMEFSVKSEPALDSDHFEVVQSNDTARVIVTTVDAGKYGITLYAKRDTLKDSAEVDLISYEPLVFKTVVIPDTIALGSSDSLVFVVPTERKDTLTCKLLNEDDFSETEISVLTEHADSFVIVFTPETKGQREFSMLITNGHIMDTLNYEVLVAEKIPVWNITEKTIDAVEGEEISVDLRDFINEDFSGDFSLDSDFGEIEDTVWKWKPLWGSDTTKTAEISASCDSDEYKLNLIISVAEGDTNGPIITLLHSSMEDTIIGSSQIYVEAVVKDSAAGVSSVQISYGSNSSNMVASEDSIYIGSVRNLKHGEKTEIKIVAKDGSMRKNTTEHVFYVTYDSTIGDNEAPVISQESGPENNSRITDGQIQLSFSVTDDSDIDSVYWTLDGTFKEILSKDDNIYSLSGTLGEYGLNELEIFAVDKSIHRNRSSLKLVYDYNTEINAIKIVSPEDDASDVDTDSITFKWSGGNDEDGDTVFVELLYNVSNIKLTKKITGINCSTLVLTEKLNPYTEYNWYIIAYSKAYPDTVKSDIYSFKTAAVPPKIITQPDKNIDVDIGEKIVLRVNATGTPEPSYKWKKDGTVMSKETNDSLVINSVSLTDSGGYSVEVYNEGGIINIDNMNVRTIYPVKIAAGNCRSFIIKNHYHPIFT